MNVQYPLVKYEERSHCLYAHINKVNNKVYFGITRERPKDRWGRGSGYKKGTHIKSAIDKYGWDSFNHIVIISNLTHNEALRLEEYFIKTFRTQDKSIGYNIDSGGKGGYLSAEARRKQKEAGCTKEVICLETLKVYSTATEAAEDLNLVPSSVMKACNSKRYILFNYHFMHYSEFLISSPEKIAEIKNKVPKNIYDDKRKVIALETREIFNNAFEASQKYSKTSANCILCCCKERDKNRLTAGGVHWMFFDKYVKTSNEELELVLSRKRGWRACKPVVNLNTGLEYDSIEEASKATGISSKTIRYSCRGTRRTQKNSGNWVFKKKS